MTADTRLVDERLVCANAHELAVSAEPGTETPTTRTATLGRVGSAEVGLWEIDAGDTFDVEEDEIFVVLSGRGVVTFADGSELTLGPGVVVRLQAGDQTRWTIHERLRKVYVLRDDAADDQPAASPP